MRIIYTRIKGDNVTPLFKEERRKEKEGEEKTGRKKDVLLVERWDVLLVERWDCVY